MPGSTDLLGAIVALVIYISSILTFVSRLLGRVKLGQWFGVLLLLCAFPLIYLLVQAFGEGRPPLYLIQVSLMIIAILVIFLVDYVLNLDFRQNRRAVIPFVMLYFAGIGGMVGVAANAGQAWTIAAGVLFLVTATLAFVQRAVTGM